MPERRALAVADARDHRDVLVVDALPVIPVRFPRTRVSVVAVARLCAAETGALGTLAPAVAVVVLATCPFFVVAAVRRVTRIRRADVVVFARLWHADAAAREALLFLGAGVAVIARRVVRHLLHDAGVVLGYYPLTRIGRFGTNERYARVFAALLVPGAIRILATLELTPCRRRRRRRSWRHGRSRTSARRG